jgi:hypothetical protein
LKQAARFSCHLKSLKTGRAEHGTQNIIRRHHLCDDEFFSRWPIRCEASHLAAAVTKSPNLNWGAAPCSISAALTSNLLTVLGAIYELRTISDAAKCMALNQSVRPVSDTRGKGNVYLSQDGRHVGEFAEGEFVAGHHHRDIKRLPATCS